MLPPRSLTSHGPGTYHAFSIDIGCYAHMRKLMNRFTQIDLADRQAKEKMRSGPVLEEAAFNKLWDAAPAESEVALKDQDEMEAT